ncbi:MAG: IS3 family transposase [Bacteroidia bacterium]|nr:IS3 family transposase [Bacteroidia bacterium]
MISGTVSAFFERYEKEINKRYLSEQFGISRQAYYKQKQQQKKEAEEKEIILGFVQVERKVQPRSGCRKVHLSISSKFKNAGVKCGRDKFFRLMKDEGLQVKKKRNYTRTTNSYHKFRKHKNLIKDKVIIKPEQAFVSDITYIPTDFGRMYLYLTTDYYSKKIMGWHLADNLRTVSAIKAINMAIRNRQYPKRDLLHHSDRGLQYCDPDYTGILETNGIAISMTTKYDPYENAVAERVNGILKNEFDIDRIKGDEKSVRRVIKQAIEIYNTKRLHISCGYMTPEQAHKKGRYELKKWHKRFSSKNMFLDENLLLTLNKK